MSWEALEQLPDGDGFHRELIEGELQILPPVKLGHAKLAKRIFRALLTVEEAAGGQAYFKAGFKLSTSPPSRVQPDASFVLGQRIADTEDSGCLLGAPELAVEVLSPSESASELSRKVELMLEGGARAAWVVYFLASGRSTFTCQDQGRCGSAPTTRCLCPNCSLARNCRSPKSSLTSAVSLTRGILASSLYGYCHRPYWLDRGRLRADVLR